MKYQKVSQATIEALESRIAPAAVFVFTDVDGDHVKITSSKGTNTQLDAAVNLTNAGAADIGFGHELQTLILGTEFAGAVITITATPAQELITPISGQTGVSGDGFTNVGLINASTIDLLSVTVNGDLGKIVVGDTDIAKAGLGALKVQSMGKYGTSTQVGTMNDLVSRFENGVGAISIAGDANGVYLHATATGMATTAKIGTVTIKGSLIGGATADTGEIAGADGIGVVKVGGNIVGGAGAQSGRIGTGASSGGAIKSVTVGGSIIGGAGQASGLIESGSTLGVVSVKGDVIGGNDFHSGVIRAVTTIASVTVGGSVIGGAAVGAASGESGGILADTNIGSVKIIGDLRGSNFTNTSNISHTGFILAEGRLGSVSIGGSMKAGVQSGGGTLEYSGSIQAGLDIGSVSVGGGLQGNTSTQVVISAMGQATKTATDIAIKSISVAGSADYAIIAGGFDTKGRGVNGDAQIGTIKIGGDLSASSIVSGIVSGPANLLGAKFGGGDDVIVDAPGATPVTVNSASIQSAIASIIVGGQISGTVDGAMNTDPTSVDKFGIEAQKIGSIKTGTVTLKLTSGIDLFGISQTTTHDVRVSEFA